VVGRAGGMDRSSSIICVSFPVGEVPATWGLAHAARAAVLGIVGSARRQSTSARDGSHVRGAPFRESGARVRRDQRRGPSVASACAKPRSLVDARPFERSRRLCDSRSEPCGSGVSVLTQPGFRTVSDLVLVGAAPTSVARLADGRPAPRAAPKGLVAFLAREAAARDRACSPVPLTAVKVL
jgi:hypothetical protein